MIFTTIQNYDGWMWTALSLFFFFVPRENIIIKLARLDKSYILYCAHSYGCFSFRCWIDHCYHRLCHWDDLQALHDPQGNLHWGGTCVSEVQIIAILELCDTSQIEIKGCVWKMLSSNAEALAVITVKEAWCNTSQVSHIIRPSKLIMWTTVL